MFRCYQKFAIFCCVSTYAVGSTLLIFMRKSTWSLAQIFGTYFFRVPKVTWTLWTVYCSDWPRDWFQKSQTGLLKNKQKKTQQQCVQQDSWTAFYTGSAGPHCCFDTVDHNIWLQKLGHLIRIRRTALDWFKSHLSDTSLLMFMTFSYIYPSNQRRQSS